MVIMQQVTVENIAYILKSHKHDLLSRYPIKTLGIFGSYAYDSATEESDVDILVEFNGPIGLDFVLLADELEELLSKKVDLVSLNALKPKMIESIKSDLIYV